MNRSALDVDSLIEPEQLAANIVNLWTRYDGMRQGWLEEKAELRDFVYATDTKTTTAGKLPWSNSTTTPKLCQIHDNLLANYTASIFPKDKFFKFIPANRQSASKDKNSLVQAYLEQKIRTSKAKLEIIKLLQDWVLYGNCFATVDFERNYTKLETGEQVRGYMGPRIIRISPFDIVFDPTASDFSKSIKVIRSLVHVTDIRDENPELFQKIMYNRETVGSVGRTKKGRAYTADGFGSIEEYYASSYAEVLTFYGDLYDPYEKTVKERRVIKVVDRAYILSDKPFPSWFGKDAIFHSGWRTRPDNLWAMGPLDNLVGLQYRIDHLENLKADIWDLTAGPMQKIRGDVDDYEIGPLKRVYVGVDGDVDFMTPPPVALNADQQIQLLEQKMEEYAGAPRMSMGFRTPGEKTAFEVQTLDSAANRIFNNKTRQFEEQMLEELLMGMFESAKREMTDRDVIQVSDNPTSVAIFKDITKEDITADGTFRAVGSGYFADTARRVQTINNMLAIKANMPDVGVHWSGKRLAQILAEELDEAELFSENVQVAESMETQDAMIEAQVDLQEQQEKAIEIGL